MNDFIDSVPSSAKDLVAILQRRLAFAVVLTVEEDRNLTRAGLRQSMPDEWRPGDDPFARYRLDDMGHNCAQQIKSANHNASSIPPTAPALTIVWQRQNPQEEEVTF